MENCIQEVYANVMTNTRPQTLFDPHLLLLRQKRAHRIDDPSAGFLAKIAAESIFDRLTAVNRQFDLAMDLFSKTDDLLSHLQRAENVKSVESFGGLFLSREPGPDAVKKLEIRNGSRALPVEPSSVNLITSVFGLHRSNDLPGLLAQIRNALVPDGLFMAALPGDRTLSELRECLIEAESRLTGNAALRIDPFGEVRQYGNLLQRAGFALPVADSEIITARYDSLKKLVRDLRAMGATNATSARKPAAPKKLFELCEKIYFERYSDPDNRIRATFEIVQLSGWVPHESQQQPLKPGSAVKSLKDVL